MGKVKEAAVDGVGTGENSEDRAEEMVDASLYVGEGLTGKDILLDDR